MSAAADACKTLLASIAIDYQPLQPIKEGLCGAPAPILVRSVGEEPKVEINPPATISCPLAKTLSDWLSEAVQPEAKALLGSEVVGLSTRPPTLAAIAMAAPRRLSASMRLPMRSTSPNSRWLRASASPCWTAGLKSCPGPLPRCPIPHETKLRRVPLRPRRDGQASARGPKRRHHGKGRACRSALTASARGRARPGSEEPIPEAGARQGVPGVWHRARARGQRRAQGSLSPRSEENALRLLPVGLGTKP